MWLPLIKKELRDTLPLGLCALTALLVWVALETEFIFFFMLKALVEGRSNTHSIPFLDGRLTEPLAFVGGALTAVLATRQIFFEDMRKTFGLTLHLPVKRSTVFLAKMIVGMLVYLTAMTLPVLVYALWAATPGTHASPFHWSMVWLRFPLILCLPLMYFGWILTYLRPAKWHGTRLAPLITSIGLTFLLGEVTYQWWWGALLLLFVEALFVLSILWVAEERDY